MLGRKDDPYKAALKTLQDELSETQEKEDAIKQRYSTRFCESVGCFPNVAKAIESMYAKVREEAGLRIQQLDERFGEMRGKQCAFVDSLLSQLESHASRMARLRSSCSDDAQEKLKSLKLVTADVLLNEIRGTLAQLEAETKDIRIALGGLLEAGVVPDALKERVLAVLPKDTAEGIEGYTTPHDVECGGTKEPGGCNILEWRHCRIAGSVIP